jgi:ArsR family transcriptional regulator, arsenate/arsenite/antimonite-responsive transcriptional repressor
MPVATSKKSTEQVAKYADMLSAMGTEPRLRIMQLLLSAHPDGLVVGDIQSELDIPNSTLSHHLEKLKNEELVNVRRESTFLRYTANTEALQELLQFLYAECALEIRQSNPKISSSFVNRRSNHERHRHQGCSQGKIWPGSLAREDWW